MRKRDLERLARLRAGQALDTCLAGGWLLVGPGGRPLTDAERRTVIDEIQTIAARLIGDGTGRRQ